VACHDDGGSGRANPGFSVTRISRDERELFKRSAIRSQRALIIIALVVSAPLWIPLAGAMLLLEWLKAAALYVLAWTWWIGRARRRVLFVYSDSPNWKEYVEANILPKLPEDAAVLNWSHRASWPRFNISVMLFRRFAGEREFNPIGLVFERFRLVGRYRFWQPFRDAKHGHPTSLHLMEHQFLRHAAGLATSGVISLKNE
jgi:hypothetical protein